MTVTLATRLIPSSDVAFREITEEGVLLNLETGTYFGLNRVGTRAWALLLAGCDLRTIHQRLLAEYDVESAVLEADLLAWAGQLVHNGLAQEA